LRILEVRARTARRQLVARRSGAPSGHDRSYASAERRESRNEKTPTPKHARGKLEHHCYCRDYKTETYKDVEDTFLHAGFDWFLSPPPPRSTVIRLILTLCCLGQSARQRARDQANIRAARAAKARPIDILCGAFRTEHFENLRALSASLDQSSIFRLVLTGKLKLEL
jgi:hypothetical protein